MHQQPLLSVIATFHNQRDVIETTLSALYGLKSVAFELFIIEDASTDGSSNAVQSLLDYYQHDQTYYFEHTEPAGRGNSLNEALQQCNGTVLWIPESIERIDEALLSDAASRLSNSDLPYFCSAGSLPDSPDQWGSLIQNQIWPQDGHFLWNLSRIPSRQRFFNPYLKGYHSLELAERLASASEAQNTRQWYIPSGLEASPEITTTARTELIYSLLRQQDLSAGQRHNLYGLLDELAETQSSQASPPTSERLIAEARQMKQDGRFNAALELLEHLLNDQPDHQQAKQLKIEILERKRRFVEASELKHEMNAGEKSQQRQTSAPTGEIKTSIIIPTALYGKPALEHCLVSVSEYCSPESTELIVIDNASLDDTHDYLQQLRDKRFFDCQVVTNKQNLGFAASVNQGLEQARGQYACIMHNDVELTEDAIRPMEELMDAHPEYAVIGPLTRQTLNPGQSVDQEVDDHSQPIREAEYLDSFCMMVRMELGLRMDEAYQLAFFEDIDLCFQARSQGYKTGVVPGVTVEHHYGTTTYALNLDTESDEYWKNVSYFNEKWNIELFSEQELKSQSRFDQLLSLNSIVNPVYPEDEVRDWFEQLFTDEVKTEILKSNHDSDTLCQLVHLMMIMDQRDVMRRLEDRLENIELPTTLIYRLMRFYFNKNIYSRCVHYISRLADEQKSLASELYKLEILVNEKELEAAVPKLKELLNSAPANPRLYKLAGDIHQFEGNDSEAYSFYQIAHQINPFEYSPEGVEEFRLKN